MSITRIIADSDDEEDQPTSEALSPCSGPPPAIPAAHMFTHVASQGPTPGLNTPGIQDTPVVVAGVSTLSQDATRLASARSNSTDPAFFAALYSREQRAALGQDSSLASALGTPTTATVAVNPGSQQRQIHCIPDLTVLPQGLNSVVKRAAALNSLSSSLQSCSVPKQQRLNSTADGPDAQKPQNLSISTSSKSTILSKTGTTKAAMDPWAVPDTDEWMCSGEKMIKPPRMTTSTQKRRHNPNSPEGSLGASENVHPHLRIKNPRRIINSMADELSKSSAGLENNNLGVVPDISALQPNIPSTASYTPHSRQIYVAPSVLTASQRDQYREVSIAPSPKTGSDADISFDDPGGLSVNLNQRTLGVHLNAVPSSYAPTVQFSTPSEFASSRHSPPIENTLVLSSLHRMATAEGYTAQGLGRSHAQGEILPTQEYTPEKPRSVSELTASTPLTKKRKLDRWRDSSPDIILVTEAQALTSGCSTSVCTNKSPAQHGDIDLHAFDSSPPPPPPPVSAKKQRRIAPRTEEVDELAQPYVGPPQNLTPLGLSMQRPPLEQNNDASKWQPAPAPMAVMEVSRSTEAALTLNAEIKPDGVQVEPSIIAEQPGGMEQKLEEPPRSGRSVHDQIADSEDEDESDPPLVRFAPDTGKGKVPKEKEAEIPDTQSFSQHTSVSLVLGEGMIYKVAEKIQAEQSVPEKKEKPTKKKALNRKQKATSKGLPGKKHGVATAVATQEPQRQIRKLTDVIAISDDESNDDDHSSTPTSAPVSAREPELEPEVKPEPKIQLNSEPQLELPAKTAKGKTKKSITKKPPIKKANSKKGTAKSKKSATPDPLPVVEVPSSKLETSGSVAPRGDIEIPPPNPTPQESAEPASVRGRSEPTISTPTTKSTDSAPTPNDRPATLMVGKPNAEASQAKPVVSLSVSKPVYRVGLSRRSRIAPLLKIVRKT